MQSKIESILFVASKPLTAKKIAKALGVKAEEVKESIIELILKYNNENSGIVIIQNNEEYQMVSSPENREVTEKFIKSESTGELTKPQLETLTVISYCGPITKPELEQIRGVNCSLIIRNLLLRGLVQETDKNGILPTYEVTADYLRHLGIASSKELPNYEELHKHPFIEEAKTQEV